VADFRLHSSTFTHQFAIWRSPLETTDGDRRYLDHLAMRLPERFQIRWLAAGLPGPQDE
jgi:hypothetical protein